MVGLPRGSCRSVEDLREKLRAAVKKGKGVEKERDKAEMALKAAQVPGRSCHGVLVYETAMLMFTNGVAPHRVLPIGALKC